jgi:fructose-bisphosphate aldolase class I
MPHDTAAALVAPGQGILAIDESVATISSRFAALGITSTQESRGRYRELLLTAPGIEQHVSGVILYDETIRQRAADGRPFPRVLADRGILTGIKVDTGAKPLAGWPGETVTEGLDGLRERVAEYRSLGARFAKWRAVITIGAALPSPACVAANAHALARYASLCQEGGLVPVVEPEVLMAGDHTLNRCRRVTAQVLTEVFAELERFGVDLAGMVLKPSMVLPGSDGPPATVDDVAEATIACLAAAVPPNVPGIAFLSGGQGADLATAHLEAMARRGPHPWALTFSYGRALQDAALAAWQGDETAVVTAQAALLARTRASSAAAMAGCAA